MLTPVGELTGFVAIETPSDKFGPATYSCKMAFTGKNAKEMKALVDGHMKESATKQKATSSATPPYKIVDDTLVVNFKQRASVTTKTGKTFEFDVKLFDCKGKPVEEVLNLSAGSVVRISYAPYMWSVPSQGGAGCTMQLEMVQVIKAVKYNGGGENPFGEEEGTYEAAKKDTNPFDTTDEDTSGDF